MDNYVLVSTIINIGATLLISIILMRKKYHVRALTLFIFLYLIGQILGYGLGVDILKAVIPSSSHPESGATYQVITSTVFPLILAFIIEDIYGYRDGSRREELNYKFFIRTMLLVLILIGILQFLALPKLLDYILLVLAIALGGIGLNKKLQKG